MYVAEIVWPGRFLDPSAREVPYDADAARNLLGKAVDLLDDAAVALHWYRRASFLTEYARSEHHRRDTLDYLLRAEGRLRDSAPPASREGRPLLEARSMAVRLAAEDGIPPESYLTRERALSARVFAISIDLAGKVLESLASLPGVPVDPGSTRTAFAHAFPDLRGASSPPPARDAEASVEAPSASSDTSEPRIAVEGIEGGLGPLRDFFRGTRFYYSLESGGLGSLDVCEATLDRLAALVRDALDAFGDDWQGGSHVHP